MKSKTILVVGAAGRGALPALDQSTDPSAQSQNYVVGTSWPKYGYPSIGKIPNAAFDREIAKRLWEVSEELTGIRYEI